MAEDQDFEGLFEQVAGHASSRPSIRVVSDEETQRELWVDCQRRASELIEGAGSALRPLMRQRALVATDIADPLACLFLFAQRALGCGSTTAVGGLATAIAGEVANGEAANDDGSIIERSLVCKWLWHIEGLRIEPPKLAVRGLLGDDQLDVLLQAICRVTGAAHRGSPGGRGGSEHSSLNFEVLTTPASGQSVEEVLGRLDALTGLPGAKSAFRAIVAREDIARRRREAGLVTRPASRHCVFVGNPGTGKTTVARMLVDVLHASGAMPDAVLVEANRADLVGEFLGTSALKTRKMVESALGGVLFIYEAYALSGSPTEPADRFAQEAVDTLVKLMEDYREDVVVILAGYPEEMQRLLEMNPGLASRVGRTLEFGDLSEEQLVQTFLAQVEEAGYEAGTDLAAPVRHALGAVARDRSFGNARWTRNLVESAIDAHAVRVSGMAEIDTSDLATLTFADVQEAVSSVSR